MVFSLIKVKMLTLADKLCKIQKYTLRERGTTESTWDRVATGIKLER